MIRFERYTTDMRALIRHVLESCIIQSTGRLPGPAFRVVNEHPARLRMDSGLGVVYYHRDSDTDTDTLTLESRSRDYSVRIGVKEKCDSYPALIDEQLDALKVQFGVYGMSVPFPAFTLNATTGTTFGDFGIYEVSKSPDLNTLDPKCNCWEKEFSTTLKINYKNPIPTI